MLPTSKGLLWGEFFEKRLIVGLQRGGEIKDENGEIGVGHGLIAALDAQRFYKITGFPNTRGIDQPDGNPSQGLLSR